MTDPPKVSEQIVAGVDAAGLKLWEFSRSSGAVSAAANFLIPTSGGPLPVSMETDEDGDVVWLRGDHRNLVVHADGRLGRTGQPPPDG